ncbi:hypothetical protein K438DRAFT_1770078 [Mycena galopus ATCC 62051]|nr:hypothetical protein K438DRAFT_1770078 [Mycena galopus ATCC 62051]
MTEYDYSPEAVARYMDSQARIQQWTAITARSGPVDPSTPPTPANAPSIPLPSVHGGKAKQMQSLESVGVETQPAWAHKKHDAMRKMQGSSALSNLTVKTGPPVAVVPANQVYAYTQRTTPYGSQLNITSQTSDGRYIQQESYRQTTRQVNPQSQSSLTVPPVNYAPLAQNPYPAPAHFLHRLPRANPTPSRVRSKSSESARRAPLPSHSNGGIYAPPVPPIPERHRAQSSVRPPGAAAPLHPANSAYANGMYGAPTAAVSSLALPNPYFPAPQQQQQYPAIDKTKSKSSATLNTRYAHAAEARRPYLEQVPSGMMPMPQQAEAGFYATPRASKSSATLYAEPRGTGSTKSKHSKSSRRERRPPMPEFSEKMSTPHPAASQMLVHSLIPVATHRDAGYPEQRVKQPSLFKRMFLGKKSTA